MVGKCRRISTRLSYDTQDCPIIDEQSVKLEKVNQLMTLKSSETIRVKLTSGSARVDIFGLERATPAALVIVAHGFFETGIRCLAGGGTWRRRAL